MKAFISDYWKIIILSRIVMIGLLYSGPAQGELADCSKYSENCEYYSCLEAQKRCGRFGYIKGFGNKYCLRFEKRFEHFSLDGQIFIEKTRNCLIKNLLETPSALSCKQLKKKSFKDHDSCYVDSGYCELSGSDKKELYKTAWPSFWRLRVMKAGVRIKKICKDRQNLLQSEMK